MKKLHARDILFKEGEKDGKLFMIRKGELMIQKKEGSKVRNEGTVGPKSVIGIDSLLNGEAHPYTLRAIENVEVEEISPKDFQAAAQNLPIWFPELLILLNQRVQRLEKNKAKLDKIHALPSLIFLCARYIRHVKSDTFDLEPLINDLRIVNGLAYNDTFELLRGLCGLGIAELLPGEHVQIHFYRKNLPALLYRTLLTRMTGKKLPQSLLSANDQTILTAFVSAAKTKGYEKQNGVFVSAKDFLTVYKRLFPMLKLTHRAFENLVRCGFLYTNPPFHTVDFDHIEQFYANLEAVKDLVELNRVYPLLDKKLLEAMNRS